MELKGIMDIRIQQINYWEKNKKSILYKLSQIVLGVPATQVSVERCISALKFILSDRRASLSEKNLENIYIIKLNDITI